MGHGITLTTGYGWVIDAYDGDYQGEVNRHFSPQQREDLRESIDQTLKEEQVEVERVTFGYDFQSLALVAKASMTTSYDWYHTAHPVNATGMPAFRRELLNALEALGWEDAKLGEPKWLHLVLWG